MEFLLETDNQPLSWLLSHLWQLGKHGPWVVRISSLKHLITFRQTLTVSISQMHMLLPVVNVPKSFFFNKLVDNLQILCREHKQ
jgi:hypothetical protein